MSESYSLKLSHGTLHIYMGLDIPHGGGYLASAWADKGWCMGSLGPRPSLLSQKKKKKTKKVKEVYFLSIFFLFKCLGLKLAHGVIKAHYYMYMHCGWYNIYHIALWFDNQ